MCMKKLLCRIVMVFIISDTFDERVIAVAIKMRSVRSETFGFTAFERRCKRQRQQQQQQQ